ncbi:CTSL [Cordylochernes scorpioides]|uniref:CTSL n=1 Tax=Cordylochernes scorpioides TaxID=51811 RepID=A0ABY6JZY1_9ARAC|nr:CTSL [Cordylochernes scorpioides]
MKFLVALTLLALGSQCLARPTNDDDHHWERFKTITLSLAIWVGHFNNFRYLQELHGKNYQGLEDQVRKAIFEEKLKKIVQHNLEYDLGMHSYYLGINKYSDWSSQEFNKHMNGLIISEDRTMDLYEPSGDMELPSSLDWRSKGYVTEVKDQEHCGSCWAFSTTGALEGQHYRKSGKLVSLSEQNLVDCSTKNDGCGGGLMRDAFEYIMKNGGIDTEESYPYLGYNDDCHYNKSNIGATCKGYKSINQDEESLKQALAAEGPISIAIDAGGNFQMYRGGVYNNPDCANAMGSLNHGVLLVGYGQENGMDYWLVKNRNLTLIVIYFCVPAGLNRGARRATSKCPATRTTSAVSPHMLPVLLCRLNKIKSIKPIIKMEFLNVIPDINTEYPGLFEI